ncbi:MAG TPA: hypothetical protein VIF60_23250 [Burkholderiaceae bacterium]|jgi:hypothetical protein
MTEFIESISNKTVRFSWTLPKFKELAIYLANILLIAGAVLISIAPKYASTPAVFVGFFVGHVCLTLHANRTGDRGLRCLSASMALLDFYAIGIRL